MSDINEELLPFHIQDMPIERVCALAKLITLCQENNIGIKAVKYFQHGFCVVFENTPGDAILHDNSYGRFDCDWETYKMPWDEGDVSVHDAETLVKLLVALKENRNWRDVE